MRKAIVTVFAALALSTAPAQQTPSIGKLTSQEYRTAIDAVVTQYTKAQRAYDGLQKRSWYTWRVIDVQQYPYWCCDCSHD